MPSKEKIPLSVIIIARNEEKNLRECLASIAFAKEIVFVDDFSTDDTLKIANEFGVKTFQRAMDGNFGEQKTFALSEATQPWVLFLDCDERVTPELEQEIRKCVSTGEKCAYTIKRLNYFKDIRVKHGVLRPDFVLRLAPREETFVEGKVHEQIKSPFPRKKLNAALLHFTCDSWDSSLKKLNHYTKLAAEKSFAQGEHARFFRDIVLRPVFSFFKMYILKRGFLDGKIGWILSTNHYFYTQMKYVRLLFLERDKIVSEDGDKK